jgi:hypothetical protein
VRGQRVLDCRVVGEQLRGQVGLAHAVVMPREVVAAVAEGAYPQLRCVVRLAVRVERSAALLALYWWVWHHLRHKQSIRIPRPVRQLPAVHSETGLHTGMAS